MKRLTFIFLAFLSTQILFAQTKTCLFQPLSYEGVSKTDIRNEVLIVPVVFHIVYHADEENLPASKIIEQLQILNEDFNKGPDIPDFLISNSKFRSAYPKIQFQLATTNPSGQVASGIIRKHSEIMNMGDRVNGNEEIHIKYEDKGGSSAWNPKKYLNIWVANRTQSLAFTSNIFKDPPEEDGIVIHYQNVGFSDDLPYHLGKTLSHEVGHYFGLLHPWGNTIGCDQEGDLVDDTPFQAYPNTSCSNGIECGNKVIPGNIMDFGVDECLIYFTKGQIQRMHDFIYSFRSDLLEESFEFETPIPENDDLNYAISKNFIEVYFNQEIELKSYQFYSIAGQLVKNNMIKSEYYLNIEREGIPPGIYLLVLESNQGPKFLKIFLP